MIKRMDHVAYPKSLKRKSDAELRFIIKDAHDAAKAMPGGVNEGYYLDEVLYCCDELAKRRVKMPG